MRREVRTLRFFFPWVHSLGAQSRCNAGRRRYCLSYSMGVVLINNIPFFFYKFTFSYQLQTEGKYLSQAAKDIVCVGNAESGATLYYWLAAKQTFVMLATVAGTDGGDI